MEFFGIILISAIISGFICMKMAEKRNYIQKYRGFLIGFFFGIFALTGYLILAIVEKIKANLKSKSMEEKINHA